MDRKQELNLLIKALINNLKETLTGVQFSSVDGTIWESTFNEIKKYSEGIIKYQEELQTINLEAKAIKES